MRRTWILSLLLAALVPGVAPAGAETWAVRDVRIVDVERGTVGPRQTIVVDGDTVRAVGARVRVPAGARVVDGGGRHVIPGLWDSASSALSGLDGNVPGALELLLAHGVTGIRTLDTAMAPDAVAALERDLLAGRRAGPRLVWTGRALHQSFPPPRPSFVRVESMDEAFAELARMADAGAHYVRLGHGFREDGYPALVAAARSRGLPVSAWIVHGYARAVGDGVAVIDHFVDLYRSTARAPERDTYLAYYRDAGRREREFGNAEQAYRFIESLRPLRDEPYYRATIGAIARAGVPVSTNMATMLWAQAMHAPRIDARRRYARAEPPAGPPPANTATARSGEEIRADLLDLHRAGVVLLAGTGAGQGARGLPGPTLHDELELMVRAGLTPREALATATVHPARTVARLFPRARAAGAVAAGAPADFVVLDADPLEDIAHVGRIHGVAANGRWFGPAERAALLDAAERAAATPR